VGLTDKIRARRRKNSTRCRSSYLNHDTILGGWLGVCSGVMIKLISAQLELDQAPLSCLLGKNIQRIRTGP
jgi:hypothetical protein